MWDRFLKWCYPNVGSELPLSLHRERLDLRPFLLLVFVGLFIKLVLFML